MNRTHLFMQPVELSAIPPRETAPGYAGRFIHTAGMTLAYFEIKAGSASPEHAHVHEQVSQVLEGVFQLTVAGEPVILKPGVVLVIPSNVRHSGLAITDCKLLDIFNPVREDFRK
jgi:quercetin dioxygenase-like cupin family protein